MDLKLMVVLIFCVFYAFAGPTSKEVTKDSVTYIIQATNQTKTPNILFIVDAVQCLKEAFTVYTDDAKRAEAFAELYSVKHEGIWNVAIGYTTILTHSDTYVELSVQGGKDSKDSKSKSDKPSSKAVLYRIFN